MRTCARTASPPTADAAPRPPPRPGWALMALLAPTNTPKRCSAGIAYLVETQNEDGTWDEPWFTGTGFPGDFYINYHLYRLVFPLMALGRYVRRGDSNG